MYSAAPHLTWNGFNFRWYKILVIGGLHSKTKPVSPDEFRFHIVLVVIFSVGKSRNTIL